MRKQVTIALGSLLLLGLNAVKPVEAKRLLPRFRRRGPTRTVPYSSTVSVSPRLRSDRLALIINFGNLQNATSVTYTLTYTGNGINQGAGGTIRPEGETSASRELVFGTCSAGVCNYHTNISGMKLEIVSKLTSGKTSIKRYQVNL